MIRLAILLLTRRWGLIIIGAALLIGGLIYGTRSHPVTYQSVGQGTVAHFLAGDSIGYLEMNGSSTLYVLNENDFTPTLNGINTFSDGDTISFVYRTDDTTDIDQTSTIGTHLSGPAYTVVELTTYSDAGQKVYNTSDYSQHPSGTYQNNWLGGGTLAFVGLIIIALAFVLPSLLKKNKAQLTPTAPAYNPANMGMNMQSQPHPYNQPQSYNQQPYQNPGQYEQYGQFTPNNPYSPQQGNQYPPNPYNQPYGQAQLSQSGQPSQPGQPGQSGQHEPTQRANPYNQPPQQ